MRPTDLNIAGAVDLSSLKAPATPAGPPADGAPSPHVLDVTEATFEEQVLRRSLQVPVLVDFWADWCGPCKQLSPVLERLAAEAGGAWVLAKVDVDSNQALAGQLQIQSIPTVLLALGGRLIQGFTGALPEREVRSFLEQVLAAAQQAGLPGPGAGEGAEPGPPPADEIQRFLSAAEAAGATGASFWSWQHATGEIWGAIQASPNLEVPADVPMSARQVAAVQAQLRSQGYWAPPTSVWDEDTVRALQVFQIDRGMAPSGVFDTPTRDALVGPAAPRVLR